MGQFRIGFDEQAIMSEKCTVVLRTIGATTRKQKCWGLFRIDRAEQAVMSEICREILRTIGAMDEEECLKSGDKEAPT